MNLENKSRQPSLLSIFRTRLALHVEQRLSSSLDQPIRPTSQRWKRNLVFTGSIVLAVCTLTAVGGIFSDRLYQQTHPAPRPVFQVTLNPDQATLSLSDQEIPYRLQKGRTGAFPGGAIQNWSDEYDIRIFPSNLNYLTEEGLGLPYQRRSWDVAIAITDQPVDKSQALNSDSKSPFNPENYRRVQQFMLSVDQALGVTATDTAFSAISIQDAKKRLEKRGANIDLQNLSEELGQMWAERMGFEVDVLLKRASTSPSLNTQAKQKLKDNPPFQLVAKTAN